MSASPTESTELGRFESNPAAMRSEFRCRSCGYGIFVGVLPGACPMCKSDQWEECAWRPFTRNTDGRWRGRSAPTRGA